MSLALQFSICIIQPHVHIGPLWSDVCLNAVYISTNNYLSLKWSISHTLLQTFPFTPVLFVANYNNIYTQLIHINCLDLCRLYIN